MFRVFFPPSDLTVESFPFFDSTLPLTDSLLFRHFYRLVNSRASTPSFLNDSPFFRTKEVLRLSCILGVFWPLFLRTEVPVLLWP